MPIVSHSRCCILIAAWSHRLRALVAVLTLVGCAAPALAPSPTATGAPSPTETPAPTLTATPAPIQGPTRLLDTGSGEPRLSGDGRWVTYLKYLSPNSPQAALLDRQSGDVTILSVPPGGAPGPDGAVGALVSGDGQTAAFFGFDPDLEPDRDRDCPGQGRARYCGTLYIDDVPAGRLEHVAVGLTYPGRAAIDISADGQTVVFGAVNARAVPDGVYLYDRETARTDRIDPRAAGAVAVSADGEVVAYEVEVDGGLFLFLYDRQTKATTRVAEVSGPEAANATIGSQFILVNVALSADGRYAAFASTAPGLANPAPACRPYWEGEFPICAQVYVFDRQTGAIEMVSLADDGQAANATNQNVSISGDGRFVAFTSFASNLAGPFNCLGEAYCPQVYVRDRQTGKTTWVSRGMDGQPPNGYSDGSAISGDGRWLAFTSTATNLIPNGEYGIYITDLFDLLGIAP